LDIFSLFYYSIMLYVFHLIVLEFLFHDTPVVAYNILKFTMQRQGRDKDQVP
jgi:hypothetical protein